MPSREELLTELRTRVREVTPVQAWEATQSGAVLIDVRDDGERSAGMPRGALGISRGFLELRVGEQVPDRATPIYALCGSGTRSLFAADTLRQLGYATVASVAGGYAAWLAGALPIERSALDTDSAERYSRHLLLPEVGAEGQARLARSTVVLIGAGGLGSPAAYYLAAAGVGRLCLVDDDHVERSNLQRQILHADARVGMLKTESARMTLTGLNPRIQVDVVNERLLAGNVESVLADADVVIDGADNFPTRYLLNAACLNLGKPLVYGAVHRFTGQVSVFDPRDAASPCYRCLFPEPPSAAEAPNCAEAGVLGVLPGVIGLLQATEAIKLLLGRGDPLVGRLLCYDALAASFRTLRLGRDPQCPGCSAPGLVPYVDIEQICAAH
ncbi:molybdopterin-synthase adenylyltransferase MoeB [Tahibacter amnicola]|uniref:Molybdopterin-synthase adenylyltransferase MoeB n=1 Tax=Tahibacter amnicola TaxID=2976241 RepID=A0ABY6B9R5_9GAMM|nr:molybdopterin-synthase adenylyltransferase MoeB [Tahibacter amnicola]UXI66600.1 molybdopterin-synthase adenylyltransferase MoeB [Tahibacter amnicola]